jgi:hypothetical protein
MALKTDVDPAELLRDYESWKLRKGFGQQDVSQTTVGAFMAERETDPQRMNRAALDLGAANFDSKRTVTGVMAGSSTASGRPFQAFATMPNLPKPGVTPDAMRAMQQDGRRTNEQTGQLVLAAPPPTPDGEAVRRAMGDGQPVQPVLAGTAVQETGGGAQTFDPMSVIPASDRLTLKMWEGSRDTGGIRRYNAVAKKYGMAAIPVKPDMAERRRAAGGVPNWAPDGRGGLFNPMTGETKPAEAGAAEQWKDDGKGGTYNVFTGEKRPAAAQEPQGKDRMIETSIPGVFLDAVTQKTVKVDGAGRPAKDNFLVFDNGDVWNAETQQTVRKGNPGYKDEYQGPNVAREAGKGTYLLGTWNDKGEKYEFKPATSGMTVTSKDGTQISLGGDGNYDFSKLPVYADKNSGLPKKPAADAAATPGPAAEGQDLATAKPVLAPIGTVKRMKDGTRRKKVAEGKWEPV